MKNWISTTTAVTLLATLGTFGSSAWASEKPQQAAIDYRSSLMIVYKWNMGPLFAMAKGKIAYDQARFKHNAEGLARAAGLDLLSGFPKGSLDEDSEAKPEIWQEWKDFENKLETLRTESAKLAEVAAGQDQQATLAQLKRTGDACDGCHDKFREE